MKNLLLLSFLLLIGYLGYSQFYLGESEYEVRQEMIKSNVTEPIKEIHYPDNTFQLSWKEPDRFMYVAFTNGMSDLYMFIPTGNISLKEWIKMFNSEYVVVSETEWKIYSEGKIYDINLSFNSIYKKYAFQYTLSKQ